MPPIKGSKIIKKSLTTVFEQYQRHHYLEHLKRIDFGVELKGRELILHLKNKKTVRGYFSAYMLLAGQYWSAATSGETYKDWPAFIFTLENKPFGQGNPWGPMEECANDRKIHQALKEAAQVYFDAGQKEEAFMLVRRAIRPYEFYGPSYFYEGSDTFANDEDFLQQLVQGTVLPATDPWLGDSYKGEREFRKEFKRRKSWAGFGILKFWVSYTHDANPLNRLGAIQKWLNSSSFHVPKNILSCHKLFQKEYVHLLKDEEPYIRECALAACERIMYKLSFELLYPFSKEKKLILQEANLFYLDTLTEHSVAQPFARTVRLQIRKAHEDTTETKQDTEWFAKLQETEVMRSLEDIFYSDQHYKYFSFEEFKPNVNEILTGLVGKSIEDIIEAIKTYHLRPREILHFACKLPYKESYNFYQAALTFPLPEPRRENERENYLRIVNNTIVGTSKLGEWEIAARIADYFSQYTKENIYIAHSAACAYAQTGQKEKALAMVKLAVENQYEHLNLLKEDEDLDSIKEDPRFIAFFPS